jgi:lycopene cyclase domain-containing protein
MLPAIAVLLYLVGRTKVSVFRQVPSGFVIMVLAALIYTTPWDNYLISRHVWTYTPDHVTMSLRIGYVPLEEYCFFILQPILTGLYLLYFANLDPAMIAAWLPAFPRIWHPRLWGGLLALLATATGLVSFFVSSHGTYFGLILMWAGPVIAFHWFYGGDYLWRIRKIFISSLVLATFYLCVIDRIAIEWKIWTISPVHSTGWTILGLPLEEATFFVVTNLLVLQGLLLFFKFKGPPRIPS